jgi:hypothetical protein
MHFISLQEQEAATAISPEEEEEDNDSFYANSSRFPSIFHSDFSPCLPQKKRTK